MILFLASTPITIQFFFKDIINLVAEISDVQVIVDRRQNPEVFEGLQCALNRKLVDFCIPRSISLLDLIFLS